MEVLVFLLLSLSFYFCRASDSDAVALLSFKSSITDDPSNLLSGWSPDSGDHCHWYGVTCHEFSGRVTALNLTGTGQSLLAGTLPDSLYNLTELRILSIPYNAFSGEIPAAAIGNLRRLEVLELQGNDFSGKIPDRITELSSLRVLNLSDNGLSGPIPENLIGLPNLQLIHLSDNQLSGNIRISVSGSCQSLTSLKLSNNYLVDRIPLEIAKCRNLRSLLLNGNILEGGVPAELGRLPELRVLDVSRNSLTDGIPPELGNCQNLSVLVLTSLINSSASFTEFNAFVGVIPPEILLLPSLEILWAPRSNLGGQLPDNWNNSCRLRILNLGQNCINGSIPNQLGKCRELKFLDLSSNELQGSFPPELPVMCMAYLNVSRNSLSGSLPGSGGSNCTSTWIFDDHQDQNLYSDIFLRSGEMNNPFGSVLDGNFVVLHDFSWNNFIGSLPLFSPQMDRKFAHDHGLFLNNNRFNGSLAAGFFAVCVDSHNFAMNLSGNLLSGEISSSMLLNCSQLRRLEAAFNLLSGSIPSTVGDLPLLSYLDLRGNTLSGSIPGELGKSRNMQQVLLGGNNLSGEIPRRLGEMASLTVLDLSRNDLTGTIPPSLAGNLNLGVLLLDHNRLTGGIPPSFAGIHGLLILDVSFNNLSGDIPNLEHSKNCKFFKANPFLQPCSDATSISPTGLQNLLQVQTEGGYMEWNSYMIATVASVSVILCFLIGLVIFLAWGRRRAKRLESLRTKVVVTFSDAPALNYDNVIQATGNFSIKNLIGAGGFGATYKAELVPGYLVAVKRLSMGRFQGLQQFDAEIRTLGTIRHKNLVTLVGYHMSKAETFLIYNYLSGGNLETFIHDRSGEKMHWPVIHKIALDIAQALAYLHYSCVPRILHRDIKPSNILLDEKLNAYLSDFGLARLIEVSRTHATTDVAGTFGYVAPEYATTCRVSDKSDVYSFGVVLLELMSGKRSLDPSFSEYGNGFNIVAWSELLIKEHRYHELFSPELWELGPKTDLQGMLKLASACTVESLSFRPSMKQVLNRLKKLKNY